MSISELEAEVLKLSPGDRARLFRQLEASQLHEKLSVDKISTEEKLRIMEEIWEDLSRNSDSFESPAWHGTELEERRAEAARGEAS